MLLPPKPSSRRARLCVYVDAGPFCRRPNPSCTHAFLSCALPPLRCGLLESAPKTVDDGSLWVKRKWKTKKLWLFLRSIRFAPLHLLYSLNHRRAPVMRVETSRSPHSPLHPSTVMTMIPLFSTPRAYMARVATPAFVLRICVGIPSAAGSHGGSCRSDAHRGNADRVCARALFRRRSLVDQCRLSCTSATGDCWVYVYTRPPPFPILFGAILHCI